MGWESHRRGQRFGREHTHLGGIVGRHKLAAGRRRGVDDQQAGALPWPYE
jgi:hypothetical protein